MEIKCTCPVCSVTYNAELSRLKHGRQTTCSRVCSYVWRKRHDVERRKHLTCPVCGNDFYRSPAQVKGKHGAQFCSPACHYAGRGLGLSGRVVLKPYQITKEGRAAWVEGAKKTRKLRIERDNYKHTDATRAKLSKATAKAISEGRVKARSGLEDKVGDFLRSIGINPVAQHSVRTDRGTFACCFDFYFPDRSMALEVNGTFWHSDPRAFPHGPVYKVQKRNAVAWERKLAIAKTLGIEIRQVWEHDLRKDLPAAVRAAIA